MEIEEFALDQPPARYLDGSALWGDDFDLDGLNAWYQDEALGYYRVATKHYRNIDEDGAGEYEYATLNDFHAFSRVRRRSFKLCVAIGCANGRDIEEIAGSVEGFIAIEPAEAWWRDDIGGTPATYMQPNANGDISLADDSADLFVSMGVLHHIPNVSHVLAEASRVLQPGGWLVLREPSSSMGRWWQARVGLTRRERGLPPQWLVKTLKARGFRIVRKHHCMASPLATAASWIGLKHIWQNPVFVRLDWVVSELLAFNARYFRPRVIDKFAPASIFLIAEKV